MKKHILPIGSLLLISLFSSTAFSMQPRLEELWETHKDVELDKAALWDFDLLKSRPLDTLDHAKVISRFKASVYKRILAAAFERFSRDEFPSVYRELYKAEEFFERFKDTFLDFEPFVKELSQRLTRLGVHDFDPIIMYREYFSFYRLPCTL